MNEHGPTELYAESNSKNADMSCFAYTCSRPTYFPFQFHE